MFKRLLVLGLVICLVITPAAAVPSFASTSDTEDGRWIFTDGADIDYDEAVGVMAGIGVLNGFPTTDGTYNFRPGETLTREQGAKMIAYMLLGEDAENLGNPTGARVFNDVSNNRWSAPYIAYCADMGIIAGLGDGNFNPTGKLTSAQYAKMLLTALGYNADREGYVGIGSDWSKNVIAQAKATGLHAGAGSGIPSGNVDRQTAAQMSLNAIKAPLVAYGSVSSPTGASITVETPTSAGVVAGKVQVLTVSDTAIKASSGGAMYIVYPSAEAANIYADRDVFMVTTGQGVTSPGSVYVGGNSGGAYTIELGERYFPGLRLEEGTDQFGRPASSWTYKNDEIGTYVDYGTLKATYTTGVTGKELYKLLGISVVNNYSFAYYVDGEAIRDVIISGKIKGNDTSVYETTGNGVLTQVFVDDKAGKVTITSVNTYLAEVIAKTDEKASIERYIRQSDVDTIRSTVKIDNFPEIDSVAQNDFILVNAEYKKGIVTINTDVETVTGEISKYTAADGRPTSVTMNGTEYKASFNLCYFDSRLGTPGSALWTNAQSAATTTGVAGSQTTEASGSAVSSSAITFTLYLDEYGYFIGAVASDWDDATTSSAVTAPAIEPVKANRPSRPAVTVVERPTCRCTDQCINDDNLDTSVNSECDVCRGGVISGCKGEPRIYFEVTGIASDSVIDSVNVSSGGINTTDSNPSLIRTTNGAFLLLDKASFTTGATPATINVGVGGEIYSGTISSLTNGTALALTRSSLRATISLPYNDVDLGAGYTLKTTPSGITSELTNGAIVLKGINRGETVEVSLSYNGEVFEGSATISNEGDIITLACTTNRVQLLLSGTAISLVSIQSAALNGNSLTYIASGSAVIIKGVVPNDTTPQSIVMRHDNSVYKYEGIIDTDTTSVTLDLISVELIITVSGAAINLNDVSSQLNNETVKVQDAHLYDSQITVATDKTIKILGLTKAADETKRSVTVKINNKTYTGETSLNSWSNTVTVEYNGS